MVDVRMGDPNLGELHAQLRQRIFDHIEVAARINDRGLATRVVPDDGAVLLEGGNGNGGVMEHGVSVTLATEGNYLFY